MGEGDGPVGLPAVERARVVDEDEVVAVGALHLDLGLGSFSASHVDGCVCVFEKVGEVVENVLKSDLSSDKIRKAVCLVGRLWKFDV